MSLAPGTRLGAYEILSPLGAGGMGEVYRARDPRLDRDVAIKLLSARFAADPDLKLRFDREAKASAALSHPHICPIFDVGADAGLHFIVMEYLDGESLAERLARGPLPLQLSVEYGVQIADALAEAHRHGVIHRDLKPSNVMLVRSGVKLVDFGVAKFRASFLTADSGISTAVPDTARGMLLGTLQYMAPEQLEGSNVDSGADMFGLGVLLYEMMTGVSPFGADSKASVIAAILDRHPPAASSFNPSIPAEVDRLITECLAKQRIYRPSANATVERLRSIKDVKPLKPTPAHARHRSRIVRALAVIPFAARLKSEAEDAFADGMAEALIANLGSFPSLRVISRSSTQRYKAPGRRVSDIAAELRVDAVLQGTIFEEASGLLVLSAELIDAGTEASIWSGRYECERSDVLNVQEQIAQSVATKIRLSGVVRERAPRKRRLNPECHEAFLKGQFQFDNRLGNWLEASFDAWSTAIRIDPTFAPAHAALSRWYVVAALRAASRETAGRFFVDYAEGCRLAEQSARQALKVDSTLAEAHAALGHVLCLRWHFDEAEQAYRRSFAHSPNLLAAHGLYSEFLSITNRPDDAIRHAEVAKERDPFATSVHERLAGALYAAHRFEGCIAACREGLELSPSSGLLHYFRGQAEQFSGDVDASIKSLTIACVRLSNHPSPRASMAAALVRSGQTEVATKLLDDLIKDNVEPVSIAEVHTAMERWHDALDNLERAFEQRSPILPGVGTDPAFDPLHPHPRFKRLLNGIGLSSYLGDAAVQSS